MANRLSKQAVTTYYPAIQEVIGHPERWVLVESRELVTRWKTTFVDRGGYWYWYSTPVTRWETVQRWYFEPAVESVEGRDAYIVTNNQVGWNAGARSVAFIEGDLTAQFTLARGSTGILCGLVDNNFDPGSFNAVRHGVLARTGQPFDIVENGTIVATSPVSFTADTTVIITRRAGVVRYSIGAWSYQSANFSSGGKRLGTAMFTAGDSLFDPAIYPSAVMRSVGSWGWGSPAEAGKLKSRGTWGWGGVAALNDGYVSVPLPISMKASDHDYCTVVATVDIEMESTFGFISVESNSITAFVPVSMRAVVTDIDMCQVATEIPLEMIAADYDYGHVAMEIEDDGIFMQSLENLDPPGYYSYSEALAVIDQYIFDPVLYAELAEVLEIGVEFDVYIAMSDALAEYLVFTDELSISMVIEAMLVNNLIASDSAADIRRALAQYSTNLQTGAVTRYQNFEFDGFVRVGMDTYGWKADGLYKLGSVDDDGTSIDASIEFASEDFGSARHKRMDTVFFGLATDGDVYVKLLDDAGAENVYRAYQRGGEFRADFERGRSSRYWRLKLELADATDAVLDNIEWVPGLTGRRSGR